MPAAKLDHFGDNINRMIQLIEDDTTFVKSFRLVLFKKLIFMAFFITFNDNISKVVQLGCFFIL